MDVRLDLYTGRSQPYKRPNDTPSYISATSNHSPNIIKTLPDNISKRISNISCDKAKFDNVARARFYNDMLCASRYKENLVYQKDLPLSNRIRQRMII